MKIMSTRLWGISVAGYGAINPVINRRLRWVWLLLLFSCQERVAPVTASLTAELDTTYTTIGDRVHFSVTVHVPENQFVRFPPLKLEDPIEMRKSEDLKTASGFGKVFELVFWDTGTVFLPPYEVQLFSADSTLRERLATDSLKIQVVSVADTDPDYRQKGAQLRPIKGPVPVKIPWPWKKIGLMAALLVTVLGMIWTWSRRIKTEVIPVTEQRRAFTEPDRQALKQLDRLRQAWTGGNLNMDELYTHLSLILREYIERSLYIRTLSMTTDEIRSNRSLFPFDDDSEFEALVKLLMKADLVKFANLKPQQDEGGADLKSLQEWILKTSSYWKNTEEAWDLEPSEDLNSSHP